MDTYNHLLELSKEQEQIFKTLLEQLYDGLTNYLEEIRAECLDLLDNYEWYRANPDYSQQFKLKMTSIQEKVKDRFNSILDELTKQKQLSKEILSTKFNQLESIINTSESRQALRILFNNIGELITNTSRSILSRPIFFLISSVLFVYIFPILAIASIAATILFPPILPLFAIGCAYKYNSNAQNPTSELQNLIDKLSIDIEDVKKEKDEQITNLTNYFQTFRQAFEDHTMTCQHLPLYIVWFDQHLNSKQNQNYIKMLEEHFSRENCQIIQINDKDQLIHFIQLNTSIHFILITSGSFGKEILSQIGFYFNLKGIIIFCSNVDYHRSWAQQYKKVLRITDSFDQVMIKIGDVQSGNIYFVQFGFSYEDIHIKLNHHLDYYLSTKEDGFILKNFSDIIIDIEYHKTKMTKLYHLLMSKNYFPDQLPGYFKLENLFECAKEFLYALQQTKPEEHIIRLYTAQRPYYFRIINTILSLLDENLILLAEDFIKALRYSFMIYNDKSNRIPDSINMKFYRGICLSENTSYNDFLRKFKVNDFIIFPAFTSTSLDMSAARAFAGTKGILLEITVDCTKSNKPKNISTVSKFQGESEVLLNCFSLLKVQHIENITDNVKLYKCTLIQR